MAAFVSTPPAAAAAPASHAPATAAWAARPNMLLRARLLHVTRLRLGPLHIARLLGLLLVARLLLGFLRIARLLLISLRVLRLALLFFRCRLFRLGILSGGFPFAVGTALAEVGLTAALAEFALAAAFAEIALGAALGEVALSGLRLAAEVLARRCPVLIGEPRRDIGVAIGRAVAMRGIVGPGVVGDVGAVEAIEVGDVDVGTPAPPVDVAPDRRAHECPGGEREHVAGDVAGRIPGVRRIVRIEPGAIDGTWIVDRHVIDFRIGALDRVDERRQGAVLSTWGGLPAGGGLSA